ncbi:MAG: cytochrome c family protein, partial [Nitrospirae bacterium]
MRRLLATLLSLGLATACRTAPPTAPEAAAAAPRPLRHVSAAECGRCHEAIYREWHASMHARANPLRDPIHGALYRKMVGDPTAEGVREHGHPPHCPACHVPAAALDNTTRLDARPVYLEGVTCTTCHTLTGLKAGGESRGVHSYTRSDERLQGRGHTGPASALYPMAAAGAWLGSSELCLGCHGSHRNPKGVPVCRTGEEARQGGGGITCQACHMPVVDGHASHAMLGGHSEAMVARGATVALRTAGGELRVELRNRTGHAFPTGAPFRSARLVVEGTDAAGRVVW